ncbi:MAG: hypothetical protein ACO3HP_05405 [Candidatus Nanopelagicaceae bacterium]
MAVGSEIINLTSEGLPDQPFDRAYSFCIGTQLLQTPSFDPREGRLAFKVTPNLFRVGVSGNAAPTAALGLSTADNISSLSAWTSTSEISDDGISFGIYAIGFAENVNNGTVVNVMAAGESIASVSKERIGSGVSIGFDTIQSTSHGYGLGDAVVIYSGSTPAPLQSGVTYYVIPSGLDAFKLAVSYDAAVAGSGIDITVSGGPVHLRSDDIWELRRDGLSGEVAVYRNDNAIYTYSGATLKSLRPFFWCRERSTSATTPLFKEIKVSGAS